MDLTDEQKTRFAVRNMFRATFNGAIEKITSILAGFLYVTSTYRNLFRGMI